MSMKKGQIAPRTVTKGLRGKAWWVIRKNRTITLPELMLTICTGKEKDAAINLRRWLNSLVDVGLLTRERIDDGKLTSNGTYLYTLIKDIGPKSPVVRRHEVYDPNAEQIIEKVADDEP